MQEVVINGFQLSPQQKHLWSLQQFDQTQPYRVQMAVLIEGNLDTTILKAALQNVVTRHGILGTTLGSLHGMKFPLQVLTDSSILPIQVHDLSSLEPQEQEAQIDALFQEERQLIFNVEEGSLLRTILVVMSQHKHMLLVSLPALCADMATFKNLVHEISRSYAAFLNGKELSDEPMQYINVSEWLNELLEGQDTEAGREYWHQQNFSTILTLKLPFEDQPSVKPGFKPQFLAIKIDQDKVAKLESLVQKYSTSCSIFLLTCWQILIWRLTGQSDMIVGTAYDGRNYEELEEVLGPLAKYLPLCCHLEENVQFSKILEQVSQSFDALSEWQEYFSWQEILIQNGNDKALSFFPVCFDFEEQPAKYFAADVSFLIDKQYFCIDRFKIKLSCVRNEDSLITEFHYDSNLFYVEDIKRLAGQFHTLLESVINNPEATIGKIEILSNIERQQLLVDFNNTSADYPQDKCIHHLFEKQVERTPNNTAVVFKEEQLTYTELNARANQLAHHLQSLGVGSEVLVGICVERSVEMVVGLLGILKAGGAYVPLDPAYPPERLAFMLVDSQVSVLLTQNRLLKDLPNNGALVICLDTDWETIAQESMEIPISGVTPNNLAYVIYTSGSTGRPKGVMISHRAICNHMFWMQTVFPLVETDKVLQKTPFSFDASVWEFYAPLLVGAQLIMALPGGHQDSAYLIKVIAEHKVTILQLVPSLLRMLLEERGIETCNSLKYVFCGGEALSVDLQKRFFANLDADLYNLYGPTEACIDAIVWRCKHGTHQPIVPIGRPIANTQVYILDSHLQPVPVGVPGELHIGGAGLARGYLDRPDLTDEKFIPNPFSNDPGLRLYKTGDLARYLPDGTIEFLGRTDHQVKLRGFRIELGEIEAVLSQHPAVQEVVVLAREDVPGDKRLVAYVVLNQEQASSTDELRHFLKQKLPDYMLPSAFEMLEAMPLTPNGKVDRQALPIPAQARAELQGAIVAPRTPVEDVVVGIWREVLGLEQIGIHNNFFDLGGHSLLATQIISRVRDIFQIELPLRCLFETPTVAGIALTITQMQAAQEDDEEIAQMIEEMKHL